ncbi:MAG: pentapeptide repeat-containing protein, partial [Sphingomonadales bacterium]|nr:pentapeptide repeat-containing protein [Sphingomonadales bacterium]
MTPQLLLKILEDHEKWLSPKGGGKRADFSFADLEGYSFANAVLNDAKFTGVNLGSCDLTYAELQKADFFASSMDYADLSGANASEADFRGSLMRKVNLSGSNLVKCDMRPGTLLDGRAARKNTFSGQQDSANEMKNAKPVMP